METLRAEREKERERVRESHGLRINYLRDCKVKQHKSIFHKIDMHLQKKEKKRKRKKKRKRNPRSAWTQNKSKNHPFMYYIA